MLKQQFSNFIECGTDESGRGCLAGPVTAAAVILPKNFNHKYLKDSKLLSKERRNEMRKIIIERGFKISVKLISIN